MEINIYAPVDCEVKNIEKCSDQAFADKMLGEGIVIIPEKENFVLPFENAKCTMLFETKHAYGFKINDELDALIHCGIDSVKLDGLPFTPQIELNEELKLNDPIFNVDLNIMKQENVSSETPIVFDPASAKNIKIENLKEDNYKQGDLICKVSYESEKKIRN